MRIENKPTSLKYKNFIFELKLFMRFEKGPTTSMV